MPVHVFTLVLDRRPTDEEIDALVAASCHDAIFGVERGMPVAEFDRECPTLADAIATAVLDLDAGGLRALRMLDGELGGPPLPPAGPGPR